MSTPDPVAEHNGDDRCGCLAAAFNLARDHQTTKANQRLTRCQQAHPHVWQPPATTPRQRPATFGEQVAAADTSECAHGEPRGAAACALCRAGIERTNFAMAGDDDDE